MADDLREPLLAWPEGRKDSSSVRSKSDGADTSRGKIGGEKSDAADTSLRKLGAVAADTEVTVTASEIRAAAVTHSSSNVWMHGRSSPPHEKRETTEAGLSNHAHNLFDEVQKRIQAIDETEIRKLLIDHVDHNCCWGSKPATRWSVQRIEDCNAYVGTLETFIEEREVLDEVQPYTGSEISGKDKGRTPDCWEVDMKAEIPLHFSSEKEVRKRIPHSELVKVCEDCSGCGNLPCHQCKEKLDRKDQSVRWMMAFSGCHGRLSSRTGCKSCHGKGKLGCMTCHGHGALLQKKVLVVRWRTIVLKRVCATKYAQSVPDEVFHKAKRVQLYQIQSYQCEPACFLSSDSLSSFSESIIGDRGSIPESSRVICERHNISLIPVTRVVMVNKKKSFKFYILGLSKEIYAKDYPARGFSFCGLCIC